ncbi:hypothetical protein [Rhodococcus aetherivorans]|uniref:hypothetical protein n=1 Tax=Rhodococcus aetherivorans TaxID=191292 RepID=UPI003890CB51
MNQEPKPDQALEYFQYRSSRDNVLHDMAVNSWADESYGDPEAHVVLFARISNSEAELQEVTQAFEQSIAAAGLEDTRELIGHFLVVETLDRDVVVMTYDNDRELLKDYGNLCTAYESWLEDQEEAGNE